VLVEEDDLAPVLRSVRDQNVDSVAGMSKRSRRDPVGVGLRSGRKLEEQLWQEVVSAVVKVKVDSESAGQPTLKPGPKRKG
jgi:hypothetical protein